MANNGNCIPQNLKPALKQRMRTLAQWTPFNSKNMAPPSTGCKMSPGSHSKSCGRFGSFRVTTGCLGSLRRHNVCQISRSCWLLTAEMLWQFSAFRTLLTVLFSSVAGARISGRSLDSLGYRPFTSCWHDNDRPWSLSLLVQNGIQNGFVGLQVCFLWNAKTF